MVGADHSYVAVPPPRLDTPGGILWPCARPAPPPRGGTVPRRGRCGHDRGPVPVQPAGPRVPRGGGAPLADHVLVAYVVANTVGMVVSYRGTRSWAFRDRPAASRPTADGWRSWSSTWSRWRCRSAAWRSAATCSASTTRSRTTSRPTSIGLFLGLVSRFYLFRVVIFRSPPPLPHLHEHGRHELGTRPSARTRRAVAEAGVSPRRPELRPRVAQLGHQLPEQRQAHPDHVVVVALDAASRTRRRARRR